MSAPTVTVRPVSEASTATLTFTLVNPAVVEVRNEYGDAVQYPLRDLTTALLSLWTRGTDVEAVAS